MTSKDHRSFLHEELDTEDNFGQVCAVDPTPYPLAVWQATRLHSDIGCWLEFGQCGSTAIHVVWTVVN